MPQAAPFDTILEQCHDLISERVSDALANMLDEADEALTALGSQSRDPVTKKLYEVTRNKVLAQRETIITQFRMRFLREFQERGNRVKKIGDALAEVDLSSFEQERAVEDDLDESLKFDAMASRLRQYCDEELLALDQRVGVLIGDADLQSEDNPFTPKAIVDAYKHTCRQIDSNVDVQMVLLKLFDDYVLDEIRGVYKAVNALLIQNSILPKVRLPAARGKDSAKAQSGEPRPVELSVGNASRAPLADNIPQELRITDLGTGINRMDTMTLDVMAVLFDDLFDNRKIPTVVKGLIGRLQTPMLKLAIADTSFFSKKSHPARRLLDELSEFSARLPVDIAESDPVYQKLESILESLIEGIEDDVRIFDEMRRQLDALILEISQRTEQKTQPVESQVDQKEKLALAKRAAEAEIKARVRGSVPQLIVKFLLQQWGRVLIVIHVREGETSKAWKDVLKTADALLWSVEPKETTEERQKLVGVVPGLLKRINAGLNYAGIDDEVRVQFFAELRKLHAANFGRSAKPGVEAPDIESVINEGTEDVGTNAASGKPETGDETEAGDPVPDSEAAASIAEPDEAEISDTAERPDSLPMQDEPDKADTRQKLRLDYLPSGGKTAAIPEQADTATVKTVIPGDRSPNRDSSSATMDQEVLPEFSTAPDAAPDEPGPVADSLQPLEFETDLLEHGEQNVAPDDAGPIADSVRTMGIETELPKPSGQVAAPADAASGAQSLSPEQPAGPAPTQAQGHKAAERMPRAEPEPKRTQSTSRSYDEPSAQLLAEMDKAMEATRTLFSDVDRFLILGKVQSAISLLDYRITREPDDRDSWVKLMAVYRDEGMNDDFERAYAAFCKQFGKNASA